MSKSNSPEPGMDGVRQKLAAIEHERWADWQKWMHSKMVEHSDGKGEWVCLPAEFFKRWERQIATKYADLPAHEKASDMEQVDRYWPLIEQLIAAENAALLDRLKEKTTYRAHEIYNSKNEKTGMYWHCIATEWIDAEREAIGGMR